MIGPMSHGPAAAPVAVVGATGFVGRSVVSELVEAGRQVRAVSRDGRRLTGWGEMVEPVAADVESGAGLEAALVGADTVVHLAVVWRASRRHSLENGNVGGLDRVLAAARAAGVRRIVYVGAMWAKSDVTSPFLAGKWRAEQLVRASELEWVVLRPSILFGAGDRFFSTVKILLAHWSPGVVLVPGHGRTRFQPLFVGDLAMAVRRSVMEVERAGSAYEFGGPEHLTYRQILDAIMEATGIRRRAVNLPFPIFEGAMALTDLVAPSFPVTRDQIQSLRFPNWTDLDAFQRAFGAAPRPLDLSYLR